MPIESRHPQTSSDTRKQPEDLPPPPPNPPHNTAHTQPGPSIISSIPEGSCVALMGQEGDSPGCLHVLFSCSVIKLIYYPKGDNALVQREWDGRVKYSLWDRS